MIGYVAKYSLNIVKIVVRVKMTRRKSMRVRPYASVKSFNQKTKSVRSFNVSRCKWMQF